MQLEEAVHGDWESRRRGNCGGGGKRVVSRSGPCLVTDLSLDRQIVETGLTEHWRSWATPAFEILTPHVMVNRSFTEGLGREGRVVADRKRQGVAYESR